VRIERILLLGAFAALAALGACAGSHRPAASAKSRLAAVVSIPPQAYFLERLGGDHVAVEVLVAPGQSPATYEPAPSQMVALDEADVYFRIGVPFETALLRKLAASLPHLNVVDTRRGIALRPIEDAHHGGGPDPHIWLDPRADKTQARTMRDELVRLDPDHAADYDRNLAALDADLDRVDREIARTLAPLKGREILVFHPAYGYFADAYGLKQTAIEMEGKEPSAAHLAAVVERAKETGVKVIFVQPQFSTAAAEAIAKEIGGAVVPMDPMARDVLGNLEAMAETIKTSLEKRSQ